MRKIEKLRLGDLLVETKMITAIQLQEALNEQARTGEKVGELLVEKGWVTEQDILEVLEFQLGIPHIDLSKYLIEQKVATMIPEAMARRHKIIPVQIEGKQIKLAMSDPLNIFAIDDVKLITKMEVIPMIATAKDVTRAINQIFTSSQTKNIVDEVEKQIKQDLIDRNVIGQVSEQGENQVDNAPTVRLVNNIIDQALAKGASDIHIEPFENYIKIRYRIDGQLQEMTRMPKETLNPITTRVKILSKLNIAERRLPQDGRIARKIGEDYVDLRISILPTIFGEKTTIRIIYRTGMQLPIEKLGLHPKDLEKLQGILRKPHGIILVTGPTGSGKSTTLASMLRELNKPNVNVITVEDPVENMIEGINQVAINAKAGLTFASALRSILRQDPDIIMVGEMRDSETSSIAIRAAITGHLVLSTLHTNDATSSVARLVDMGSEPFMVGTAIEGIIAQRLVRKICANCKIEHEVTQKEEKIYKLKEGTVVYKGRGCTSCNHTGYKGRMAVHEVFVIDGYIQDIISSNKLTAEQLRQIAIEKDMRTLRDNVLYKVLNGETTLEEMIKVSYE